MTWHKWLVRGLVFTALGLIAAGCALYAMYTSPATVRQLVQEKLGVRFQHVSVQLDSARLRLLGGIQVNELRLSRSDGLDNDSFLYVPTAVIFHDKEQVLGGQVAIRKLELFGAKLRLVRERDGRFNLAGILGETDLSERVPAVVVRNGTLVFEDRAAAPGAPLVEVRNLQMTILNDPLPTLQVEGQGEVDVLGPVRFRASVARDTMAGTAEVTLPAVPVGERLFRRVGVAFPDLAAHLAGVSGQAEVTAKLRPGAGGLAHDVTVRFRGRAAHPALPRPLEGVQLEVRLADGQVPSAKLTAAGLARVTARLAALRLPDSWQVEPDIDELLGELDVDVEGLQVDDAVLARLPADIAFVKEDYSPAGAISFSYRHRRRPGARPERVWTVRPQGMTGSYIDFRYPIEDVRGTIRVETTDIPRRNIRIDLAGRSGATAVALKGHMLGPRATSEVNLDLRGTAVPLDDRIFAALPPEVQKVASAFLPEDSRRRDLRACPMGAADFEAAFTRQPGTERILKRFTLHFKDTRVMYDAFPYPLERVSGTVIVHPDHWECRGLKGHHAGGEMSVEGRSYPLEAAAGGARPPQRVCVTVRGKDVLLDDVLEQALTPRHGAPRRGLREAWKALALAGRLSFEADVVDTPNQPQDIKVAVEVKGVRMRPSFFDYALDEVCGSVHYAGDRVDLTDLTARHGAAELRLARGTIVLGAEGGFTAWLTGLGGSNVPADEALYHALPEGMRRAVQPLKPERPLNGSASLTIVSPPGGGAPQVWWEGGLALNDDRFQAGVQVQGATGRFHCKGHHDGRRLRGVSGGLALQKATVLGQPLTDISGRLEVRGDTPDVVRFRDLKAQVFGGRVVGEGLIETAGVLRYELLLDGAGVQLEAFGKHNLGAAAQAQLSGAATAALHLSGEGGDLLGLKGNGRVDVARGKMGQLPVLLDLIKAFGLRRPDRTAFEEAHAAFSLEGPQMRVQELELIGNAVSLQGAGKVDLDGSNLNLDFCAKPGRIAPVPVPGVDAVTTMISEQLLKIKMRGKLGQGGQLRFEKEIVPGVSEPLKRLLP